MFGLGVECVSSGRSYLSIIWQYTRLDIKLQKKSQIYIFLMIFNEAYEYIISWLL